MHDIVHLIETYRQAFYLITFLWTAVEGETFVIFAGLAAQKGMLNIWALFMAAWLGTFCCDQVCFWIGRHFGIHILERFPKLKHSTDRALGWLERHAVAFILAYRFMYGIRNISGVAIGMSHLPFRKFMAWNAVASFIWAAVFAGFGYLFSDVIAHMHRSGRPVEQSVHGIMLTVLGLFMLIVLMRIALSWHHRRQMQRASHEIADPRSL